MSFPNASWAEICVDHLMLYYPERAQQLLHSYFLLLGESDKLLWWQRCAEAEDPRWATCIRSAIVRMSTDAKVPAPKVADMLDLEDFPRGRQRILRLAREAFYAV